MENNASGGQRTFWEKGSLESPKLFMAAPTLLSQGGRRLESN
jgi:hypothetical protein